MTHNMRGGQAAGTSPDGKDASQLMDDARTKAAEVGQQAQEKLEQGKDTAASGMESAADKIRERTQYSDGVQAKAGTKVAEGMEKTAGYLKEHDTNEMVDDLEKYVREHPVQALAGAVVGGFLVGRILR
jgi:ElaB/YqjD/DUF883 family membrane-anchored ribosome-binding protein